MQPKLAELHRRSSRADPAVENVVALHRRRAAQHRAGCSSQLKPLAERKRVGRQDHRAPAHASSPRSPAPICFCNPVQDIRVGGRQANAHLPVHAAGGRPRRAAHLGAAHPRRAERSLPAIGRRQHRPQDKGLQTSLVIDRDAAARLGVTPRMIDTDAERRCSASGRCRRSIRRSNQYHVVMEAAPEYWQSPQRARPGLRQHTPRRAECRCRHSRTTRRPARRSACNHQSQFVASTISFNLPEGRRSARPRRAINGALAAIGVPATIRGSFQGTARAFQDFAQQPAVADSRGAADRLHRARHAV